MIDIVSLTTAHFASLSEAMVFVAKEGMPGAFDAIPTRQEVVAFALHSLMMRYPHVVAIEGSQVVGWCHIVAIPRVSAHGSSLVVCGRFHQLGTGMLPAWRGKGVAKRLVESAVGMAFARGADRVILDTVEANPAAVRLYDRCGFTVDYKRKKPFSSDVEIGMSRAK